jgi:hypothetical protein
MACTQRWDEQPSGNAPAGQALRLDRSSEESRLMRANERRVVLCTGGIPEYQGAADHKREVV